MRITRVTAAILSFILFMGNPMYVFATQTSTSVSENSVSENSLTDEEEASTVEESAVEETESTPEAEEPLSNTINGLPEEYIEIVEEAQVALTEVMEEKDLFAIVYLVDSYAVKEKPDPESATVISVPSAKTVQVLGMEVQWTYDEDWEEYLPTTWYETQFYVDEVLYSGYIEESNLIYSDELLLQWKNEWYMLFPGSIATFASSSTSYADVMQFPSSYQVHLKKLKDAHPNWTFVPMNVSRKWDDCVSEQVGNYSWIYYNQPAAYRGKQINSTWYYASRAGIEYYMDPRNFLAESNIFQFEQNTYNASYHTQSALQSFLNGTFMAGTVPGDTRTYAAVIFNSGKSRGLSPFNLAARVIQEQGVNGTSAMISGTYSGYEGYYNHYNISASGSTNAQVLASGLSYAKKMGWNTRTKSLEGGAAFIGNGYILKGQDTLYLQKFDIEKSSGYLHQYMQNIMAPYSEGRSMKTMYTNAGSLNSAFVFKIPVYKDMPGAEYSISAKSLKIEKGKTTKLTVYCDGVSMLDGTVTFKSADTKVATVSSSGTITAVGSGTTTITATVNDYEDMTFTCTVNVYAPLKGITLSTTATELFLAEGLPDKVPVMNDDGVTIYKNKSDCPTEATLTVAYDPVDTTDDRTVKWTVKDESVLQLTADSSDVSKAKITAVGGGTTMVTAKVGSYTQTVEIYVRVPLSTAYIKEASVAAGTGISLHAGEKTKLTVAYQPYNTNDLIDPEWYVDEADAAKGILTIEDGNIVAQKAGTATVHAAVGPYDGSQDALSCKITVEDYQITFMKEDGSILMEVPGVYGSTLGSLQTESGDDLPWEYPEAVEGYAFAGWYTQENGNGDAVTEKTVLYGDMTLYPYFYLVSEAEELYVKPIGNVTYTGGYLKPDVTVYSGTELLTKGTDYTVTYKNNISVSNGTNKQPTAVITGKGAYAGMTAEAVFTIVPKNISHVDVTVGNLVTEYTGKVQKVQPTITDSGRTLQKDVDYTLEYPETEDGAYIEAGTYAVKISGKGNYTGTRTAYVSISKRVKLEDTKITVASSVAYNNGNAFVSEEEVEFCRPDVTVTYSGKTLTLDKDYTLVYADNKEIGTASVTIVGKGTYVGSVTKYFTITGTDFTKSTITGILNMEYTGSEVKQSAYAVKDKSGKVLIEGNDFTVAYEDNKEEGKAYITFTGVHGYTGSLRKSFTIQPYDIAANSQLYTVDKGDGTTVSTLAFVAEISADDLQMDYDKDGAKPGVEVSFKGVTLTEGKDYSVSYENNYAVSGEDSSGEPMVVVTGKGNFTGTVKMAFTIVQKNFTNITMQVQDVTFRNRTGFCFVDPVLRDTSGRKLTAGMDYDKNLIYTYVADATLADGTVKLAESTVEETDIPTAGTKIRVTAEGTGNYTGTISANYKILENTSWLDKILSSSKSESNSGVEASSNKVLTVEEIAIETSNAAEEALTEAGVVQTEEAQTTSAQSSNTSSKDKSSSSSGDEKNVEATDTDIISVESAEDAASGNAALDSSTVEVTEVTGTDANSVEKTEESVGASSSGVMANILEKIQNGDGMLSVAVATAAAAAVLGGGVTALIRFRKKKSLDDFFFDEEDEVFQDK